jgi:diadenosine tetraphosphate (Ap4A) HIT family hydrolase
MEPAVDCIFCRILAGSAPASFIYEDALCSAFLDIQPVTRGHVLVVPKRHAVLLGDLDEGAAGQLLVAAQRIAAALRPSPIACEGINLFLADGRVAGQEVWHAHLHVIPRTSGDGFGLRFPPDYGRRPTRSELDDVASRIRDAL